MAKNESGGLFTMKLWHTTLSISLSLVMVAGCTPDISPNTYSTSSTQQVSSVEHGTIINVTQVKVEDSGTQWAGTLAGGAAGAVLGGSMGEGTGSMLLGIGGAVLGGVAGNAAERKLTSQTATQYIIQ